jgi:hypothetical protein
MGREKLCIMQDPPPQHISFLKPTEAAIHSNEQSNLVLSAPAASKNIVSCSNFLNDAYELMIQHAQQIGANALVGVRYDATEISPGVSEVLCYGTAVLVVPVQGQG